MKARVLVVDDETTVREELCDALRDAGYDTTGAENGLEAAQWAQKQSYDVCISDIRMPALDGLGLLQRLSEISPETMVIMTTAYGDMKTAIEALRGGAVDYLQKPVVFEDLVHKVNRLVEQRRLLLEVRNLRVISEHAGRRDAKVMVGESAAIVELRNLIAKVGPTRSNVLIIGESGTGKELIARSLHDSSARTRAPFVPINCAAIPEPLLESELFGHVKGAFTGAIAHKEGLLKTAADGTIFLDEIGDMPLSIQGKLLRAIESREIQPVGSVRQVPIEARIVAATNKDLERLVAEGKFREDLYYRLAVVVIRVPPLRDRREDIPLLVNHFLQKLSRELGRQCLGVESQALRCLAGYDWRGNIRELENALERALILTDAAMIGIADLPESIRRATPVEPETCLELERATASFERQHIHRVISACEGDKKRAAKMLGVSLSSLYRKLDLQGSRSESEE
ncbi:MAG: sigma-54 dependent transcriptional regulator [Planctomycetes bacterium]|nr:sigma-54 dependent transcriptional regulator [Planctomycetota bacterium]